MRLELIKYTYSIATNIEEINFFGNVTPATETTLDLTDYLLKDGLGEVEYSINAIDNDNSLYSEASNLNISCIANINNGTDLNDYFELDNLNYRLRFVLKCYDENDNFVYSGTIRKDNISIDSIPENILNILVVGFEKEFSEYYKNKTLVGSSDLISYSTLSLSLTGNRFYRVSEVLKKNFPNVTFDFDIDTSHFARTWLVSQNPYTYYPLNIMAENNILHIPSGYDSFVRDEIDRYQYMNNLCLCMGWYWYFKAGIIYINKLSDNELNVLTIDCNTELIDISFSNTISNSTINNVVIKGGELYGLANGALTHSYVGYSYSLNAQKFYKYSINDTAENFTRSFKSLNYTSTVGGGIYSVVTSPHTFIKGGEDTDLYYKLKQVHTYPAAETDENSLNYKKLNTIYLTPYVCSRDNGGSVDRTNARTSTGVYFGNGNSFGSSIDLNSYMIRYTGNVGESLIKYNTDINKYMDYNYYSKTTEFENNFKTFIVNSGNNVYTIKVKRLITDLRYLVNLINFSYQDFTGINFLITKLKYNLQTGISELTLQQS